MIRGQAHKQTKADVERSERAAVERFNSQVNQERADAHKQMLATLHPHQASIIEAVKSGGKS